MAEQVPLPIDGCQLLRDGTRHACGNLTEALLNRRPRGNGNAEQLHRVGKPRFDCPPSSPLPVCQHRARQQPPGSRARRHAAREDPRGASRRKRDRARNERAAHGCQRASTAPGFRLHHHAGPDQAVATGIGIRMGQRREALERRRERAHRLGDTARPSPNTRGTLGHRCLASMGHGIAHRAFVRDDSRRRSRYEKRARHDVHEKLRSTEVMRWHANRPSSSEHSATPSTIQPSGSCV